MGNQVSTKPMETGKDQSFFVLVQGEVTKSGRERIVVTEFPYGQDQVPRASFAVQEKRIEGITAVRDESNREGVRFVIEVRRDLRLTLF